MLAPRSWLLAESPTFSWARHSFAHTAVGGSLKLSVYVCVWMASAVWCGDGGAVLQICPLSQEDIFSDAAPSGKTSALEVGLSSGTCVFVHMPTEMKICRVTWKQVSIFNKVFCQSCLHPLFKDPLSSSILQRCRTSLPFCCYAVGKGCNREKPGLDLCSPGYKR